MKIYHGGFLEVSCPRILEPSRAMDFGNGFYTTTSFNQAKKWSLIKKDRFHYEKAVVSAFEVDNEIFKTAKIKSKVFPKADEEWLDFVMANRQDIHFVYDYDVVMGAVANDNVYASLNLYEDGFLSKKELLDELIAWKYVDQICFHTEKSLNYLEFIKSEEVFQ
ncbi:MULTISPECIES: DUF3990 domain-containing protein [Treponema]|uniref:Sortase n=1 Tax=Treponema succinifaciens (strain ATCC 33096 / DSM 2489 / 6091) TaxID=869209 RepID=F2NWD0_TRES6|nr:MULTISPECIES: DUF3990 domain-containing protein [Treponema]AEB15051.1 hypothetical protein Tresu_2182 [Treponema succinifaciens DSM 2489]MCI6911670.1 DUF3990 domain-containing protein [Treponema succinifaciens]MDD6961888.1 DUF3990 domain-containing protein [Treponema succinifaciens]MDY5116339.1 DUF3990 domain-containing protein [Treponema succinifaciens]